MLKITYIKLGGLVIENAGKTAYTHGRIDQAGGNGQALKALRESEEKFRVLAELSLAMIWLYQDEDFVYVNRAAEQMTGYAVDELLKMKFWEVVHPDDRDLVRSRGLARQRGERVPELYEVKLLTKGGETKWVELAAGRIEYRGRPAGIATFFDVTERKRTEEALRMTQFAVDHAPEAIFWTDIDGHIFYVNDAACDFLGYTKEELLAKSMGDIDPFYLTARCPGPDEDIEAVHQSGVRAIESVHCRKDGTEFPVEITSSIIRFDGKEYFCSYVRDVTVRKKADALMRENDAYLSRAQKIAHLGSWVWDLRTNRQRWSDESYRLFGFVPGEVEPDYDLFVSLLHPDDRERVLAAGKEMMKQTAPYNVDYRVIRPDGTIRYVHAEGEVSSDDTGQQVLVFGINQDITEHKCVEDELIEARAMAELYLDLMGHDINNMHQIALGYLEIARELQANEMQKEFIDRPIEVLQRSARLIRNVRKLQKLREGAFMARPVDLCEVLAEVRREYGSLPEKAIAMDLDGYEHCYVLANELLYDVFANLVSNAIKHTGSHASISVSLKMAFADGRRQYVVSVEDNGPGIPDGFKREIFNRMLKGTAKAKGMGLGLYLVRTLVNSYGGRVWVEDRVPGDHKKGAKFVVMLPEADK
ncbi:MAG: putative diguanylate cyclase [Methanocella sp. PtaU1.Bin125]|nr:MAG: putative diguanylate cyclase [Methanocella sp. PtaU1.Bin125]